MSLCNWLSTSLQQLSEPRRNIRGGSSSDEKEHTLISCNVTQTYPALSPTGTAGPSPSCSRSSLPLCSPPLQTANGSVAETKWFSAQETPESSVYTQQDAQHVYISYIVRNSSDKRGRTRSGCTTRAEGRTQTLGESEGIFTEDRS